jgi:hypothetical protein
MTTPALCVISQQYSSAYRHLIALILPKVKTLRQFQNCVLGKGSFDENAIPNPYFPVLQNQYQAARDRNL